MYKGETESEVYLGYLTFNLTYTSLLTSLFHFERLSPIGRKTEKLSLSLMLS